MTDEEYMQIAIDISKRAKTPYGAIVVKDDKIIGRSDNIDSKELYHHAEYKAIQDAITNKRLHNQLVGATIYSSCEPCLMCLGAILYEGISKLVFGAKIEDSHKYYCPEVLISCKDVVNITKNANLEIVNIMREEAVEVFKKAK